MLDRVGQIYLDCVSPQSPAVDPDRDFPQSGLVAQPHITCSPESSDPLISCHILMRKPRHWTEPWGP